MIEERLAASKAVVVLWSAEAARSQWVRSEADRARQDGKLVQVTVDGARLPMPFNEIQCVDLAGWSGDANAPGWRKVAESVAALMGDAPAAPVSTPTLIPRASSRPSILVLPFANMSDDAEQGYFSDGISEDIITDLGKVSTLSVVARHTAFSFKGRAIEIGRIAGEMKVSHVLEGSVRRAGGRVRISAQLVEGASGHQVWAERWDREMADIFALQDEISQAIVAALRLRLLPEEKQAIAARGTANPDAYSLYLQARQHYVSGNQVSRERDEAIIRLTRLATDIDPDYAQAWALMGLGQAWLESVFGGDGDDGLIAADRALAIDPGLADARAVRAKHFAESGEIDTALQEIRLALQLDPESYEANETAGLINFRVGRLEEAIAYYEKAAALMESDFGSSGMLTGCYMALGDREGALRTARVSLARCERALAKDPANGGALGFLVAALAMLGERAQAKEWIGRALRIDPDNRNMRYNFACALADLKDVDGALELLGPFFETVAPSFYNHALADPDLALIRADPRFTAMAEVARTRLGL